jgi:3-oxoacyl-(acyl-carrier-protein) synthase
MTTCPATVAAIPFRWPTFFARLGGAGAPAARRPLFARALEEQQQQQSTLDALSSPRGASRIGDGRAPRAKKRSPQEVCDLVRETVQAVLGRDNVAADEPLMAAGLDSLAAVELRNQLEGRLKPRVPLPQTLVFDFPSIAALQERLVEEVGAAAGAEEEQEQERAVPAATLIVAPLPQQQHALEQEVIVLAGCSGRMAGGYGGEPYSAASLAPRDGIAPVPLSRWDEARARQQQQQQQQHQSDSPPPPFGGWLPRVDLFDAAAFGVPPAEALLTDAQQRLLLEASLEALRMAAAAATASSSTSVTTIADLTGGTGPQSCAIAVGIASAEYSASLLPRAGSAPSAYSATGGALSVAAGRLAYVYNARGPVLSVDTACSSSMNAAHLARERMLASGGGAGAALVGGVGLLLSPGPHAMFHAARMLAADGRCKTLDAAADGYVRSEGCGVLFFQRRSRAALTQQQQPLPLLLSTASNSDGRSSALTAPNGPRAARRRARGLGRGRNCTRSRRRHAPARHGHALGRRRRAWQHRRCLFRRRRRLSFSATSARARRVQDVGGPLGGGFGGGRPAERAPGGASRRQAACAPPAARDAVDWRERGGGGRRG